MGDDAEANAAPGPEAAPAIAETHLSVLIFIGDRAYKLKKPLDLGFVDFRTREARQAACHRETELNRRLAPDVYLGVADVVGPDGALADHLVVMRRMPASRRLSTLVADGDPSVPDQLHQLARQLVDFHRGAERSPVIDAAATADAVLANWHESFEQLRPFEGRVLDEARCRRVEALVDRYVEGRRSLFDQRIADGHVCDGHGDLQAADVYLLDDGPRVLDCIEFNDRYRHLDVANDVAFLAMDLDRLGAPDLGAAFLSWYRELAGERWPTSLVEHYVAYRAHVRCKVNCLRSAQTSGEEAEEAGAEAARLLNMAHRYLERARVRLVLVGGLPGTGKSTLARSLGHALGWTVLRSDEIRKELAGLAPTERAGASFGEGLYRPETSDQVYAAMLERAATRLAAGETVVLDASWTAERHRARAREVASTALADLDELRCTTPEDVAAARLRARAEAGTDASDATPEIAARLAEVADPWPASSAVDTSGTPDESCAAALAVLGIDLAVEDVVR